MAKKKEIKNVKEIFIYFEKRFIKWKKNAKKIGYPLFIKRLNAQILWFSFILLLVRLFQPNLSNLFSLSFAIVFTLISNFISTFFDEKITYIIAGKFFDKFSNNLLNQSIYFLLTAFMVKIILFSKMVELGWIKKNEK